MRALVITSALALAACTAPYKSEADVIAKSCSVVADKFDRACPETILVAYRESPGRYYGYTLGPNAIVMDKRCQDAHWGKASKCVHILAHEVAHAAGLQSDNDANYVANRVWNIGE